MTASESIGGRVNDVSAITARQRLIVVLLLGANFMMSADFSILNVALPVVGEAVGLNVKNLPWLTTAFALPAAGLSLLFGRLGDLYGRRGIFLAGLSLLAAASLIGGVSTGPTPLLISRTLQGVASAMTVPVALSLLITTFADERQRAWALGLNGSLLSAGFTVGAIVGGMLVGMLSWRWAFLINVPFALPIIVLTPMVVPAGRSPHGVKLDVPGAVSVTLGLFAIVFGIIEWSLVALIAGLALLALFFRIEGRAAEPLIALDMLALPSVRWGNFAALIIFSMEAGFVFLVTLYLQDVQHLGPLKTGLIFGVPGLASVTAGVVAGRIVARRGARIVLLTALLVQGGMTAPLILLGTQPTWLWLVIPALFASFFGHITAVVAATVIATSEIADANKGLATGLVSTSQRVAVTVGIPVLGAVMATRSDLLAGIHLALAADVLLTVTAVVIITAALNRPKPA